MEQYLFPFGQIEKTDRIIIYGAGSVGVSFWQQVKAADYCDVVLWADKNYREYQKRDMPVSSPDEIKNVEYDKIIISVIDKKIMYQIRNELLNIGADPSELVWSDNYLLGISRQFTYKNSQEEYEAIKDSNILEKIPALQMVSYKRLDVIIRYLVCRDIVNEVENDDNLRLYFKFFLTMNGAEENLRIERISYFTDYSEKYGLDSFLKSFRALTLSMKKNGFQDNYYIPVDSEKLNINGSHRIAAALALEEDIWVKNYNLSTQITGWDYKYFENLDFNNDDMMRILRGYADLYPNCAVVILFANCENSWQTIEKKLAKNVRVVGKTDLEFDNNLYGFCNIVKEIFCGLCSEADTLKFIGFILSYRLHFRVILVSDEGIDDTDRVSFFSYMNMFGESINKLFVDFEDNNENFAYVLSSKNKNDFSRLKEVVLSANNVLHEKLRFRGSPAEGFDRRLDILEEFLVKAGIEKNTICIFAASVMELFGLAASNGIWIFSAANTDYKDIIKKLPKNFVWYDVNKGERYKIYDSDFYFIYRGFKFMNLEQVRIFMEKNNRKKECRILQLFFDYQKSFSDTKELKERFETEMRRQEKKLIKFR